MPWISELLLTRSTFSELPHVSEGWETAATPVEPTAARNCRRVIGAIRIDILNLLGGSSSYYWNARAYYRNN